MPTLEIGQLVEATGGKLLRGDAGAGQLGPQRRAHRVQVDHAPVRVLGNDPGLGPLALPLADHHRLAIGVGHDDLAGQPRTPEVFQPRQIGHGLRE